MAGLESAGGSEQVTDSLSPTLTLPQPEKPKQQNFLEGLRQRGRVLALAAGLVSLFGAAKAKAVDNIYPWPNAKAISGVQYGWWIDENGNGRYDGDSEMYDPNGMTYRNCTSWAAYVEARYGVKIPFGQKLGHAKTWDDNAPKYGFKVDTTPRNGDVAVWNGGTYGHVAFVDSVNSDGSVNVSQYNRNGDGKYNQEPNRRADTYIHFMTDAQRAAYEADYGLGGNSLFPRVEAVSPADFNGDGFGDIEASSRRSDPAQNEQVQLGANWLGPLSLWGAPGEFTYKDALNLFGDINGDGRADLIIITPDANGVNSDIWQQLSWGSSFGWPEKVGVPGLIAKNTRWAMGDFNGDGHADLAAFSKRSDVGTNLLVFPSLGDRLGGQQFWGATGGDIPFANSRFLPGDKYGSGRDGLYAIAKHPDGSEPYVYFMASTGQNFVSPALTAVPGYPYEQVQFMAGKFDRNNTTDLLMATPRGDAAPNLQVMASDGGNSYKSIGLWSAPGELRRREAIYLPADLNRDGLMDVLAVQPHDASSQEEWWLKSTGSSFESPRLVGVPAGNANDLRIGR